MLGVEVSDDLLRKFKAKTVLNKTTMKNEIQKFMTNYVEE